MERNGPPAALLLDMMMPDLNWHNALRRVRFQAIHTKVVVATAFPTLQQRARFEQADVRTVLSKPEALDDLLEHLRQIVPSPQS